MIERDQLSALAKVDATLCGTRGVRFLEMIEASSSFQSRGGGEPEPKARVLWSAGHLAGEGSGVVGERIKLVSS